MTLLDKYLLGDALIIVLVVIQNGISAINSKQETDSGPYSGHDLDQLTLYVICGLWGVHHLFFAFLAKYTFDQRRALDVPQGSRVSPTNDKVTLLTNAQV